MKMMGKIAAVSALIVLSAAAPAAGRAADRGTGAVSVASSGLGEWVDFTLPDTRGEQVSLAPFIGKKPVLLVFWATWCPPCHESVPVINRMHTEPPTRDALQILALDFMESEKKVNAFISSEKVVYPVLFDRSGSVARKYRVVGIPTYILIDRDGKVAFHVHEISEIQKVLE